MSLPKLPKLTFQVPLVSGGGYIIGNFALVMVLFYGGTLVLDGDLSVGELTSFILYTLGNIARSCFRVEWFRAVLHTRDNSSLSESTRR